MKTLDIFLSIVRVPALIVPAFLFYSCANQPIEKSENDVFYERNIYMTVNGLTAYGSVVVPVSNDYKIKLKFPTDIEFLLLRTCHREEARRPKDNEFQFNYVPTDIERPRACPLFIAGIEKGRVRRAFGFIDREDPKYSLPITAECNAKTAAFNGVGHCSSGESLIQRFKFQNPVEIETPDKRCEVLKTKDKRDYEFQMVRGECSYYFYEIDGLKRIGRVSTYGYDEILTVRDDSGNN